MSPLRFAGGVVDEERRRLLWSMPAGIYVLGTAASADGPYHCMTHSLVTQAATEPCVLAAAVEAASVTHGLLEATGRATLSVLAREQRAIVRRFVKPDQRVELDADGVLAAIEGVPMTRSPRGLPCVSDALGCLELAVVGAHRFASHTLYLFEPTALAVDPVVLEGAASARVADVLRMEDTKMNYGG